MLERLDALPARLFLVDLEADVFYPVAAFRCREGCEEPSASAIVEEPPPGHHLLYHRGDVVGLLRIDSVPERSDVEGIDTLAVMLGPALMSLHNQELSLDELRQVHQQKERLTAAGRLLRHLDIEVLLVEILQVVMETVNAQVGAILTRDDPEDERLTTRVAWGLREEHLDAILCRGGTDRLVDRVFAAGQNRRLNPSELAEQADTSRLQASLKGLLLLMLSSSERNYGLVVIANPHADFTAEEADLAEVVCDMAAIALDNARLVESLVDQERMQNELDIARQVQAEMLPQSALTTGRIEAFGVSRSSDETGGDYFSYLQRDDKVVALVGDVTGHGLGAALFTTVAHSMLQHQLGAGKPLDEALATLNGGLHHTADQRFMTMGIVEIDAALDLTYCSAGHNPLLWIHADGSCSWLESTGIPLGIMTDAEFEMPAPVRLEDGDWLVLYTDGFTEAGRADDGEWLAEERFCELMLGYWRRGLAPQEAIATLFAAIEDWHGSASFDDDLTIVILRILGGADAT